MVKLHRILSLAALAPLAALAQTAAPVAAVEKPAAKVAPVAPKDSGAYMRLMREKDGAYTSEVALRTFVPVKGTGPAVTLVGAIHIGSADYYAALQRELDKHEVVLFEAVTDDDAKPAMKGKSRKAAKRDSYASMAKALGLVTQTSAIAYDRKHFVHADLSMKRMREMLESEKKAGGETGAEAAMALGNLQLLENMLSGEGFLAGLMESAAEDLGADKRKQADMLLQLAVAENEEHPFLKFWPGAARLQKLILQDRNAEVMRRLAEQAALKPQAPRTAAIFYGVAHLRDMEERLVRDLGYRLDSGRWLPAFSVNPKAAGVTPDEIESLTKDAVNR